MELKWEVALGVSVVVTVGLGAFLVRGAFSNAETAAYTREQANVDWMVDYIDSQPRSSFQAQVLDDGELTDGEYVTAFETYEECVTAAGGEFVPDPPERNQRGTYVFVVHIPPSTLSDGFRQANHGARAQAEACNHEYFDQVQQRWQVEHQPTNDEVEAAKAGIAVCLSEAAVSLPENIGDPGWGGQENVATWPRETVAAFRECSIAAGQELGMPPGFAPIP